MKTIRINGVERNFDEGGVLFQDFISGLNNNLNGEKKVISSIRIDGQEITEEDEKKYSQTSIDQLGNIEIEVSSPYELAFETLNTLEQYVDRLIASINRAALLYKEKNLITADAYFVKSIDGLDLFVQTIGGIKLALRLGLNSKVGLIEAELVSIMNDLLDAKRQNNYVFLADLLEKDLIQNLGEWKTTVFPILRSQKTS